MDSQAFTLFHVMVSMAAIGLGCIAVYGLLTATLWRGITLLFLAATALTSLTGFFFHREHILPSHIVGAVALIVLVATVLALYAFGLRGKWRVVFVIGATLSLYFNVFVLVAQAFLKIGTLHALAPNGSEPPFAVSQAVVLLGFIIVGVSATRRFRPAGARVAAVA